MKTILLIGVGQLGCRHLEGLVTSSTPLVIHAVDMSLESINLAKFRWQSFGKKTNNHKIFWNNTLPCNLDFFDVCIISSTSTKRASLVQQISKCYLVNYWILEKVLAQSSGELSHIESILMNAKGAWVNTPWRSMLLYKSLKNAINGNNTITFNTLSPNIYNNITITVTNSAENVSNVLSVTSFTILPST